MIDAILFIIPILISIFFYFRQKTIKKISYEVLVNTSAIIKKSEEIRLISSIDNDFVDEPQIVVLKFRNEGNKDIDKTDFFEPITIKLDEKLEIIKPTILGDNPSNTLVKISNIKNELTINPGLLKKEEFFEVKFFTNNHQATKDIEISARIKDTELKKYEELINKHDLLRIILSCLVFLLFLLYVFLTLEPIQVTKDIFISYLRYSAIFMFSVLPIIYTIINYSLVKRRFK